MKILAIGDFHGKFPVELKKLVKEVDLILSVGDYPSWEFKKILTVNTGAAIDGKCAIIDFDGVKGRVKNIRFVK